MADDPSHKAMLYFLEILMNSDAPLSISQLAGRFGSRSFTLEMRAASGGNEPGLRKFLLQYPSLWTVKGNMVSLYNADKEACSVPPSPKTPTMKRQFPDISTEMEAVKYFQSTLMRRALEERWVEIKRIAGHLSQAPLNIRQAVGPQLEFRDWLQKHPHIFDVQGELVGLREGISVQSTTNGFHKVPSTPSFGIRSPNSRPTSGIYTPPSMLRRSRSFSEKSHNTQGSPPEKYQESEPITMNMPAAEFKAVNYLKTLILAIGTMAQVDLQSRLSSDAPDAIRSAIGWTSPDLTRFLKKHNAIFMVDSLQKISIKPNKVNTVISRSTMSGSTMAALAANAVAASQNMNGAHAKIMEAGSGVIYHVAKLWGIVDLGKHEHVFFDRSIMIKPIDDLQKYYKIGEILNFNAVQAPTNSRAKWKATRVWKCTESTSTDSKPAAVKDNNNSECSPAQEVEVQKQMKSFFDAETLSDDNKPLDVFADVAPSGAGAVPVYNFKPNSNEPCMRRATMVPEMYHMAYELLNSIRNPSNPSLPTTDADTTPSTNSNACDACTQTTSTGSIIASAIY